MNIIIVGAGSVGLQIARQLIDEKKNVVIIDRDQEKARYAAAHLDCMVVQGEVNNIDVLQKAGIAKADYFICVTGSDEMNMIACGLVSSEFEVPYKIARVRNLDYTNSKITETPFLGIDYIVNPEIEAAKAVLKAIEHGAVSEIMLFEGSGVQMRSITVNDDSPFKNLTVAEIRRSVNLPFLVAVIIRENDYIIPTGNTMVEEWDVLYVIATETDIENLFNYLGKKKIQLHKIIIAGGSKTGSYAASYLFEQRRSGHNSVFNLFKNFLNKKEKSIVIVDKDYNKCKVLEERFPDALVLNADISDELVFEEEQFSDADLFISSTANEELNIVTSLYAKSLGIKRVIALINKNNFAALASSLEIDVVISIKNTVVNTILKFIRKGNVKSVHSISGGKVEVVEVLVGSESRTAGKAIEEIRLPDESLIIAVSRNGVNSIPTGEFVIEAGDQIIFISNKESIEKLESLFTGKQ
jgi:trk system potassium uptake protein TrkA